MDNEISFENLTPSDLIGCILWTTEMFSESTPKNGDPHLILEAGYDHIQNVIRPPVFQVKLLHIARNFVFKTRWDGYENWSHMLLQSVNGQTFQVIGRGEVLTRFR